MATLARAMLVVIVIAACTFWIASTQYGHGSAILGGVHGGLGLPVFPTAIEAGAIVIAVTGSSYTAAANDLVANWFEVSAMN